MKPGKLVHLLKQLILAVELIIMQTVKKRFAYRAGYLGHRLKGFSSLGEDSRTEDIDRLIRVRVIDRDNLASSSFINYATVMLRPVLKVYVKGLQDGCCELGNPHIFDASRQFQMRIAAMAHDKE